jgi:hypothetical protein
MRLEGWRQGQLFRNDLICRLPDRVLSPMMRRLAHQSVIPKSVKRFSERIMLQQMSQSGMTIRR